MADQKNTILNHDKRKLFDNEKATGHFGPKGYYTSEEENVQIIEPNFENKLHQSRDITKNYYSKLKNELLSYGATSIVSYHYECFQFYELILARLAIYCGRIRLTLEFNKKRMIKSLRKKFNRWDSILISNGYIELFVDDDEKLHRAIDLISVFMKDLDKSKDQNYQEIDFAQKFPIIEHATFAFVEDDEEELPEIVVKGEDSKKGKYLFLILFLIACLLLLTGITTCTIVKTKRENNYPTFDILDKEGNVFLDNWTYNAEIDIFGHPNNHHEKIIYPGKSDTYYFYIENTNNYDITCDILFNDINKENINMKFRLRISDAYFPDSPWLELEQINIYNMTISKRSKVLCAIDWIWEDSDRDTEIGEKGLATYTLDIIFSNFSKIDY